MQAIIIDRVVDIKVTSVIITHDMNSWEDPHNERLHMFYCFNCRQPLFQYAGRVATIVPGASPLATPVLLKCQNCKNVIQLVDII